MVRAFLVVVCVSGWACGAGCASADGAARRADGRALPEDLATLAFDERGPSGREPGVALPPRLPEPDTARDAQLYLQGAVAALRAEEPAHAALFLEAILRSDHLTDRGRANVYWLLSEARRQIGDDRRMADALSGFLVAASVLDQEPDVAERTREARVNLTAALVRLSPALGTSPAHPIRVPASHDATRVVEHLGCGPQRDMPWVERSVQVRHEPRTLEARTLTCTDDGTSVTLWFDVTGAD